MNASMPLVMAQTLAAFAPKSSDVHRIVSAAKLEQVPARIIAAGAHKTPNALVNPVELKGLVEHEYAHANVTLNCFLEYEKSHYGGTGPNSDESYPESITLIHALVNGADVACLLSDDMVSEIEAEALAAMSVDAFDADFDRGEDRYLDRMES